MRKLCKVRIQARINEVRRSANLSEVGQLSIPDAQQTGVIRSRLRSATAEEEEEEEAIPTLVEAEAEAEPHQDSQALHEISLTQLREVQRSRERIRELEREQNFIHDELGQSTAIRESIRQYARPRSISGWVRVTERTTATMSTRIPSLPPANSNSGNHPRRTFKSNKGRLLQLNTETGSDDDNSSSSSSSTTTARTIIRRR